MARNERAARLQALEEFAEAVIRAPRLGKEPHVQLGQHIVAKRASLRSARNFLAEEDVEFERATLKELDILFRALADSHIERGVT